jgi:predicted metal-dependent hydrolase
MAGTLQRDSIRFGSTEITYTIRRSRNRATLGITVCGPWVEVAAPYGMRAAAIRPHVEKKAEWVLQKLDLARRHAPIYPKVLAAGASIRLFGRQHLLRIHEVDDGKPRLDTSARQFHLRLPSGVSADAGHALFKKQFKAALEARLPGWLETYAAKLRIKTPPFQVRELGNRWGSCAASGKLQFHWLLATQPTDFVRQVVAHEVCHLIEPLHSKRFMELVSRIHS